MTQAKMFSDYFFEKVGTLPPTQVLKQANMLFGKTINYDLTDENKIYFVDGSFLEYTMMAGITIPA